jgi:mercuric ion transport protein
VSRIVFVILTAAFGVAVLVQIFFAGEAAMLAPKDWERHLAWVHLFQWVSIALPVAAYAARRRVSFAALNCVPIVVIGLQYFLIHRAMGHGLPFLAGLHAVLGALLVGYVVFLLQLEQVFRPRAVASERSAVSSARERTGTSRRGRS